MTITINASTSPGTPSTLIITEFRNYIRSGHPKYDWGNCLRELRAIAQFAYDNGENPRTGELASCLGFTGAQVRKYAEAMSPKYVRIDKSNHRKPYVLIGSRPYYAYDKAEREFSEILEDLELLSKDFMPDISDNGLRARIESLIAEIFEAFENSLFRAVSIYHRLIQMLEQFGIHHNLRDARVQSTANRYELTTHGEDVFLVS
jgi:hypothetical protein